MRHASYQESQWLWMLWLLLPAVTLAVGLGGVAADGRDAMAAIVLLALVNGGLLLFLGRLTVEVYDDRIEWRFGLLGRPRWSVPLAQVVQVEPARTRAIEGWGIRSTREGMLYNASGSGAVRLVLRDGRRIRLGTADPQRLAGFIRARLER